MNNTIVMKLPNGNEIVAEKYKADADFPEELTIYLRDKDGTIIQDICLVRSHYEYNNSKVRIDYPLIDCLVWADEDNEDYTDKFIIPQYTEEEENDDEQ